MPTLGQQLSELIDQQKALLDATTDPRAADKINARLEDLDEQRERLIDNSWDQTTSEYQNVVAQLSCATKALKNARKGLQDIDAALKLVDSAVSAIASLAPLVVGA
jgi:uncharacterized protein YukE